MDGWKDRWMDGWKDRWMDEWINGRINYEIRNTIPSQKVVFFKSFRYILFCCQYKRIHHTPLVED